MPVRFKNCLSCIDSLIHSVRTLLCMRRYKAQMRIHLKNSLPALISLGVFMWIWDHKINNYLLNSLSTLSEKKAKGGREGGDDRGWRNLCYWAKGLLWPWGRKPNSDSGCLQQSKGLLQVPSEGMGDKSQTHSNLISDWGVFIKGKNKKPGIDHLLVIFLWHFLIVFGEPGCLRFTSHWSGDPWAGGSVSSSCPGETAWVCSLMILLATGILFIYYKNFVCAQKPRTPWWFGGSFLNY